MKLPLIAKASGFWIGFYLFLKLVMPLVTSPLPSSIIFMYMTLITVAVLLYVSVYEDDCVDFFGAVTTFIRGDKEDSAGRKLCRTAVFILIPLSVGMSTYDSLKPSFEAPFPQRVIHPAPPGEVAGFNNPFEGEEGRYDELIQEGRAIYYENCVFCHGDKLDGKGLFANALNVKPANFADPTTISMLMESFVFWRVSKGGIGLPGESTPWDSAMPPWELILTEEERWKAIMFLYEYTGFKPRTWE